MPRKRKSDVGAIGWFDLTVENAPKMRALGEGRMAVIQDPAGAVAALYEQKS